MNDLISRQAAIDAINEYDFEFPNYMERFVTELKDAMKADLKHDIEALPSAQPDLSSYSDKLWRNAYERGKAEAQHWIPVTERLPEEDGEYITIVEDGEGMFVTSNDWRQDWKEWGFLSYYGESDDPAWRRVTNVVAWMPLPEPHKNKEGQG